MQILQIVSRHRTWSRIINFIFGKKTDSYICCPGVTENIDSTLIEFSLRWSIIPYHEMWVLNSKGGIIKKMVKFSTFNKKFSTKIYIFILCQMIVKKNVKKIYFLIRYERNKQQLELLKKNILVPKLLHSLNPYCKNQTNYQ